MLPCNSRQKSPEMYEVLYPEADYLKEGRRAHLGVQICNESQLSYLAVWLWANNVKSLSFRHLLCYWRSHTIRTPSVVLKIE